MEISLIIHKKVKKDKNIKPMEPIMKIKNLNQI